MKLMSGTWRKKLVGALYLGAMLAMACVVPGGGALAAATGVAAITTYQGPDRERLLVEGARTEGELVYYTVNANANFREALVQAFTSRYPFVKVSFYRTDTPALTTRVLQEYRARRYGFDAIEMNHPQPRIFAEADLLQPFYSPHLQGIRGELTRVARGDLAYSAAVAIVPASIGYNTRVVPAEFVPQSWADLKHPSLRGLIAIPSSSTGVHWLGAVLEAQGEAWVRGLKAQRPRLVSGSGRAIAERVASGEYALTPAYYRTYYLDAVELGQPVNWVPLSPMYAVTYYWGIPTQSRHPHAAMLLLDFVLSEEGQRIYEQFGYWGTRKDAGGSAGYELFEADVTDYDRQYRVWEAILKEITSG